MAAGLERLIKQDWFRQALAVAAVGLLVGLIGPFGSFDEVAPLKRIAYWMVLVALSWLQWLALDWLGDWLAARLFGLKPWSWWLQGLSVTFLSAVLLTVELPLLRSLFGLPGNLPFPERFAWIAGISLFIYAGISGIIFWAQMLARGQSGASEDEPEVESEEARFLRRLPPDKRGALICIKTEDHYLRVTTVEGEALILMRLKDAVAELADVDGRQVHRSYWVARAAVRQSWRAGRKRRLALDNGIEIPVSETFAPDLKAAGWFDRARPRSAVTLDKSPAAPNIEAKSEHG